MRSSVILFKRFNTSFYHRLSSTYAVQEIQADQYGIPNEVLKLNQTTTLDSNQLKANEVLIQLLASPINPADINTIEGKYALLPSSLPATFGNEGVFQVIDHRASNEQLRPGDWVIPKMLQWGNWRSHAIVSINDLIKIPSDIKIEAAATLSVNPCTAYRLLKDFVTLEKGDTVIQNGGNSSVGQAVIQLGKLWNINVVNIIRNRDQGMNELVAYLKSIGAEHIYIEEDLRKETLRSTLWSTIPRPKLGFNCVGGKATSDLLRVLDKSATLVTYGGMSKQPVTIPTAEFIFRDLTCQGFWMSQWKKDNYKGSEFAKMLHELIGFIRHGHLKPPKCQTFSLTDYKVAIDQAQQPMNTKKILLTP
ncbi:unnamed protein product [Adineta steineri]|uniref:Enoyl-[acyl-carrier-protein] reductase, mitochondrial n=1 Tax=Adineta steineri TaxID=433720 RepID=A0A813Y6M2_9BILA|nr:unnamed protein product [Adineta steineri]CAF0944838.1 unnamed protein product [Adineta steineri]CAF3590657.1 unnamed protein product [Adineta steineri]CAF3656795.1 unnamed protein product [Adineta steineri]